ncbi:MAG: transcriptional repressor [Verrucomicrobiota bacterium]
MRETRQRRAIRNVFQQFRRPLQAREVMEFARSECTGLGMATVYRNLGKMLEHGELHKLTIPGMNSAYCLPQSVGAPLLICQKSLQLHWLEDSPIDIALPKLPADFDYNTHVIMILGQFQGA